MSDGLLSPANEVAEGNIFSRVYLSTGVEVEG